MLCIYVCLFVWLVFTSHRLSLLNIATFQLYWWRKTSSAFRAQTGTWVEPRTFRKLAGLLPNMKESRFKPTAVRVVIFTILEDRSAWHYCCVYMLCGTFLFLVFGHFNLGVPVSLLEYCLITLRIYCLLFKCLLTSCLWYAGVITSDPISKFHLI
jgi:hypothetical protein